MITVFYYTLRESLARRMGIVLLALCVLVPAFYLYNLEFEKNEAGIMMVSMGRAKVPVDVFVRFNWVAQFQMARGMWTMLALFVAAPLLSSYLEKGWADLLLTKGVARWQVLIGRLAGSTFIFILMLATMHGTIALYFSYRTGISAVPFLYSLGLVVVTFFCILSLMALVGIVQPNAALLVIVGFIEITFSSFLAARAEIVEMFRTAWLKPLLDGLHAVLPQIKEMGDIAGDVLNKQPVQSWTPLWLSLGLAFLYIGLACYALHRKAI